MDPISYEGDGSAVGVTDKPAALRHCMITATGIVTVIEDFEFGSQISGRQDNTCHHDHTTIIQTSFATDICSLVKIMKELAAYS